MLSPLRFVLGPGVLVACASAAQSTGANPDRDGSPDVFSAASGVGVSGSAASSASGLASGGSSATSGSPAGSGGGSGSFSGSSSGVSLSGGASGAVASSGSGGSASGGASGAGGSSGSSASGSSASGSSASGSSASGSSASGSSPDGGTLSGSLVDQLLARTAPPKCTAQNTAGMAPGSHIYADPGSQVPNDPICALKGAVYWNADMDVDCDGRTTANCPGTGVNKDCCYQPMTSFVNLKGQYLAAEYDRYTVIPLDFTYPGLDQTSGGNIVAVIYQSHLVFTVFGDQGPTNLIGEASYATAKALGINPSPASGGVGSGVTYIAFVGANAKPHDIENQQEVDQLGLTLAQQFLKDNP